MLLAVSSLTRASPRKNFVTAPPGTVALPASGCLSLVVGPLAIAERGPQPPDEVDRETDDCRRFGGGLASPFAVFDALKAAEDVLGRHGPIGAERVIAAHRDPDAALGI